MTKKKPWPTEVRVHGTIPLDIKAQILEKDFERWVEKQRQLIKPETAQTKPAS